MWIGGTRQQIRRLFGDGAEELLKQFPVIEGPLSPDAVRTTFEQRTKFLQSVLDQLTAIGSGPVPTPNAGRIFIGHGRSPLWREFKDFIEDRLHLKWDEFNRESTAGVSTFERLMTMRDKSAFAFLVMTAEDEHADATRHARENVIHEIGYFQGHLGPRKAIILLEEGCEEFSNVIGLGQIRFPKGNADTAFEKMRRVLEREGMLPI
jgi:predicted nucleotide-binding protein